MDQAERRLFLIRYLLAERPDGRAGIPPPPDADGQKRLLRALMNARPPREIAAGFLSVQDEYLREELRRKGIVNAGALACAEPGICLWQGDITRLKCDAIVNAANGSLLGCFVPCHGCIDNAIHSAAGVQLRLACQELKRREGIAEEPPGRARVTPGFNLPARFVLHTVGPLVEGRVTDEHRRLLRSCYRSCLELAEKNGLSSVAFCCVSTGEFHFPNEEAAGIAIAAARGFLARGARIKVIFNVFKELDRKVYARLLGL